jgi:hypothetical protein
MSEAQVLKMIMKDQDKGVLILRAAREACGGLMHATVQIGVT